MIDCYNQVIVKDISCTITTRVNASNNIIYCGGSMPTKVKDNVDIQPVDFRYDEGLRGRVDTNIAQTLTTRCSGTSGQSMIMIGGGKNNYMKSNLRIRKLVPLECMKLMGFNKTQYKDISNFSDSAIYHVAGDSIVVPVLMALFGELTDLDYRKIINDYIESEVISNGN